MTTLHAWSHDRVCPWGGMKPDLLPGNQFQCAGTLAPDEGNLGLEGARGIEPPPGFLDRANGFAARGAPSTIAPDKCLETACEPD